MTTEPADSRLNLPEVKRYLKSRYQRVLPAARRAGLYLGVLIVFSESARAFSFSDDGADVGHSAALGFLWILIWSLLVYVLGLQALVSVLAPVISGRLMAAIDRGRVVRAERVSDPTRPETKLRQGRWEEFAGLGVVARLIGMLGFPTTVVGFEFTFDGRRYPRRANLLFEDEKVLRDAEGRAFVLVDPEAPRRLNWLCRTAAAV